MALHAVTAVSPANSILNSRLHIAQCMNDRNVLALILHREKLIKITLLHSVQIPHAKHETAVLKIGNGFLLLPGVGKPTGNHHPHSYFQKTMGRYSLSLVESLDYSSG